MASLEEKKKRKKEIKYKIEAQRSHRLQDKKKQQHKAKGKKCKMFRPSRNNDN